MEFTVRRHISVVRFNGIFELKTPKNEQFLSNPILIRNLITCGSNMSDDKRIPDVNESVRTSSVPQHATDSSELTTDTVKVQMNGSRDNFDKLHVDQEAPTIPKRRLVALILMNYVSY